MRITLVIPSLACGGAERVMSTMANYWVSTGKEITLITFDTTAEQPFYEIDARVCHIKLGLAQQAKNLLAGLWNNLKRLRIIRTAINASDADVIISFIGRTNVRVLLAQVGCKTPIVVVEHTDPARDSLSFGWRLARLIAYCKATRVIVLTQRLAEYFPGYLQSRIQAIPNPVPITDENPAVIFKHPNVRKIIAVGRLEEEKGFDLLLRSFAALKDEFTSWSLIILGDGAQKKALAELCSELKINERVFFPGAVKNVAGYLQQSELFVLPSRIEGFPVALCEAMACGLPVIATDCSDGVRAIIRDGINGVIVPPENVPALTSAIAYLMRNEAARGEIAAHASEVTIRFGLATIMGRWEKLLTEVVA